MMVMVMMMVPKMKSSLEKRWGEIRGKWEQVIVSYCYDDHGDDDDGDDDDDGAKDEEQL